MSDLKQQIEQWIKREAKKRATRQVSTGLKSLDEALQWRIEVGFLQWHIEVGFEAGANSMLPLLMCAVEALDEYKNGKALLVKPEKRHLYEDNVHPIDVFYLRSMSDYTDRLLAEEALNKIKQMIEVN